MIEPPILNNFLINFPLGDIRIESFLLPIEVGLHSNIFFLSNIHIPKYLIHNLIIVELYLTILFMATRNSVRPCNQVVGDRMVEIVYVYEDLTVFVALVLRGFVCYLVVEFVELGKRIHYLVYLFGG